MKNKIFLTILLLIFECTVFKKKPSYDFNSFINGSSPLKEQIVGEYCSAKIGEEQYVVTFNTNNECTLSFSEWGCRNRLCTGMWGVKDSLIFLKISSCKKYNCQTPRQTGEFIKDQAGFNAIWHIVKIEKDTIVVETKKRNSIPFYFVKIKKDIAK